METIESAKTEPTYSNLDLEELRHRTEEYVRQEPIKAVAISLGVGMFLTVFPVFRILSGLFRAVFALFRPLLFCLGAVKLWEEISKRYDI
jgi:hypothetical protein